MERGTCLLRFLERYLDVHIGMCEVCSSPLCTACMCGVDLTHELGFDKACPNESRYIKHACLGVGDT